jgi:hypothetical protein
MDVKHWVHYLAYSSQSIIHWMNEVSILPPYSQCSMDILTQTSSQNIHTIRLIINELRPDCTHLLLKAI